MYVRASHQPRSVADVIQVMKDHMFATMITPSADGLIASHLPFLVDETLGQHGTLYAHMARNNPQSAVIGSDVEALVVFQGPHAYISPSWYADRATAPTWDYVAVHCYGKTRRHSDDEALQNIERLLRVVEKPSARPWSTDELTPDNVRALIRNVVSFEIPIDRVEGKFKLNQGEKPERTSAAIAKLEEQGAEALASAMRRYNDL
ncbi:MAG TPA: FMN-binding negative transcriptional regulator [Thermoanaerobaculia bacterium]|jgi:transcriptional regulator|nr:FMN-binding negative transcriptional regulator [Thermoanaerobaculia bacterium]